MTTALHHSHLTTIFPVGTNVQWEPIDVPLICEGLTSITKNVEFRTRNLELAIKSVANKDKKEIMETNLNSIVSKWHDNCKRLGVLPIGVYRCKICMSSGQTLYWEYPKGLIALPPTNTIQ